MAYFPMFIELEGKTVLIVGGGQVARRKLEKLLHYGAHITMAAPHIDSALIKLGADNYITAPFSADMLNGVDIVIAATDDRAVNREISALCRERKIPVNVVDDKELCSFIFPALVKRGNMSIGISTGGASPSAAIWAKERISAILPDELDSILVYLESLRPVIKDLTESESERQTLFKALFSACLDLGRHLTAEELMRITEEMKR